MTSRVTIDLNVDGALNIDAVRALLASGDDSQHNQIRISKDGLVFLSTGLDETGGNDIDSVFARFETFLPGNGYVGLAAAADDEFVESIFHALRKNWPVLEHDAFIDVY